MICRFFTNMLEAKNQLDLQYNFDEKLEVIKDILIQEWGLNYNIYLKRSQVKPSLKDVKTNLKTWSSVKVMELMLMLVKVIHVCNH